MGVKLLGNASTYPPPPNPLPPGEGELLRPTFCKVSVENDNRPPGPLKMVVRYAHQQPDMILDALFQDLQVITPFQHRDEPAPGGLLGQVQQ